MHAPRSAAARRGKRAGAFTVVELMIGIAIVGILAAIAIPQFLDYRERVDTAQAVLDIQMMQTRIGDFRTEYGELPLALSDAVKPVPDDPWGNPYEYLNLEAGLPGTNGMRRRDKNMNPINSDFDLYSKGPDGESQAQLVAAKAKDDIVRAADGGYVGIAERF